MRFAEHMTPDAAGFARGTGFEHQQPLQIRMNPFVPGKSRAPIFDGRIYLGERAISIGRPNLFAPEALDVAIRGTRGALGELRAVAELAFFAAASGGATQIGPLHVLRALEALIGNTQELGAPKMDLGTIIADAPAIPIPGDVVPPAPAPMAELSQNPDAASDAPSERIDVAGDEPLRHAQAESALFPPARTVLWLGRGRSFAYAGAITAALLVLFAITGLVSSQLMRGKPVRAISVSAPVSNPADFANAAVPPPPAAPLPELQAPSSLAPITAQIDPRIGGKDSVRAMPVAKVVAAKRKRPPARRRAPKANPAAAEVPAEASAPSADGQSDTP